MKLEYNLHNTLKLCDTNNNRYNKETHKQRISTENKCNIKETELIKNYFSYFSDISIKLKHRNFSYIFYSFCHIKESYLKY